MTYRGTVRGRVIELDAHVQLPDGLAVEVRLPQEELAPSGLPKSSPQAILAALEHAPRCRDEDVDALMQAIDEGKQPVRFEGPFDDLAVP